MHIATIPLTGDQHTLHSKGVLEVKKTYYPRNSSIIHLFTERVVAHSDRRGRVKTAIAFLGILKANLAYLPLDVNSPAARIADILSSIPGEKLILAGANVSTSTDLVHSSDVELVMIADTIQCQQHTSDDIADSKRCNDLQPSATSLAYVVYTSGSTGRPKGVRIEHRGVVRPVKNSNVALGLPSSTVMSHLSNLGFDASTGKIYGYLLNGGTLIGVD
ncbi:hypothetical protein V2A60_005257 [Cordyceps javanica]|uniref:AMP-binding enzyme domain-containing protein n=1 Tax=Cordyceps javanica TaxID=43265 RepID=A0A545W943_9HYPO|nr:AMP-binding enzyme domain-containing protein [Cordyceps javanica]TQW10509.1 AMP-binding enzyme domain-containing protein [Cordyceps javanica]